MHTTRRGFLMSSAWSGVFLPGVALANQMGAPLAARPSQDQRVVFAGDGLGLSPGGYALMLGKLVDEADFKPDTYLAGGVVERLEQRLAAILGKEKALFFPTGTLANHLALRQLAGDRRRVLVQSESHVYCDEGDGAQLLSGLNLVPLAPGRATVKLEEIAQAVSRSSEPPYPVPVGAISIESPVRRRNGEVVDFEEMKKISSFAREKGIGLHLDGARLFLASAYTRITPAQYAALFDTVYVSLYKYFNAPFGAVLTGPRRLLDPIATLRHQFGSGLYHAWQASAIALHYLEGFTERYQSAVQSSEALLRQLQDKAGIRVERVPNGSNIVGIQIPDKRVEIFQQRLAEAGIVVRKPGSDSQVIWLMVNETINRRSPEELTRQFLAALR
jgi:threonine aldolase